MHEASMVIGDRRVRGSAQFESLNPFTARPWATVPDATVDEVGEAVQSAAATFDDWSRTPGHERGRLMHRLADLVERDADELARLESTDNGKVIRETSNQVRFAARNLRYFAGYADKLRGYTIPLDRPGAFDFTKRRPYGVAALITAWNSPISLLANKLPPALATGNTVVIKPSEHASVTTCALGELAIEAGVPPGVVNVITGAGEAGDWLTRHQQVRKISFTGGPSTGRRVAANAAARMVPVTLELGGKSPNIIFEDADLDRAVTGAVAGIFAAAGQTCIAGSRLLVQESVYEQVVSQLVERAARIRVGDPLSPETEMGPVANRPQFDRVLAAIESARDDKATLLTGGGPAQRSTGGAELGNGLFIAPTVFGDVTPDMRIAREEIFGPVLSVLRFSDEDDALRIANDSEYGLAAGIWTRDLARAHRIADRVEAGTIWVNTYRSTAAQAPFGGTKTSGYGRERGEEALADYTYVQNTMIDFSEESRDPFSIRV